MIHSANIRNPKQITTGGGGKMMKTQGVIHSANIRNPKQITTYAPGAMWTAAV